VERQSGKGKGRSSPRRLTGLSCEGAPEVQTIHLDRALIKTGGNLESGHCGGETFRNIALGEKGLFGKKLEKLRMPTSEGSVLRSQAWSKTDPPLLVPQEGTRSDWSLV